MKPMMFAGVFNMNMLHYECNKTVESFFDLIHQRNLTPTINQTINHQGQEKIQQRQLIIL